LRWFALSVNSRVTTIAIVLSMKGFSSSSFADGANDSRSVSDAAIVSKLHPEIFGLP
jgi:hypothetical protein